MKRKLSLMRNIAVLALVIAIFSGCLKSSRETQRTCNYDSCALKATAAEIQAVKDYLTSKGLTAQQHCSGLFYSIENPGTGAQPTVCSAIGVNYVGRLTNGNVFDSSKSTAYFNLGGVIAGWQNGLPYLKTGGTMNLYVPPSLGYGNQAVSTIPANSILVFRVELVAVQ
jgi:FKBP-type peptidyl-prolyl cis-trans isomerase FkpA